MPVQALVGELWMKTGHIKEALVLAFNPPPIFGLGNAGGFEFYIQNRGEGGAQRLSEVAQQFIGAASKDPMFAQVNTLWRANVPQLYVDVDREKAKALGVPLDELYNTLAATLGTYYVNDFNKYGRTWQVLMSAEPRYRKRPTTSARSGCASEKGDMVPLASLADIRYASGPETLDRFNNLPGGEDLRRRRARDELGPGDRARSRRSRKRCCPPTSRSTGAAPRSRRRSPAAPRCSRSGWRRSWCS